ncbi:thiol reductant ABC exporter subunit CydD [Thiomonas arsenitoxydans]|uniref:thiol reductant ABC exporter subunit CydD n=1 Tax=Thiomonas arsenitoxydans (strain DSM 22701 / CIP 110005 / 3As) TaxID=426114 RepID=UPI001ACD2843|nr:thiol reductant ABC exporter subunit CydD [Thiomonas arsenitoxydans]MBN8775681.1 thiol reductant ABC exporter subunit CydD [Thiomonas arsenitoxydans]
MATSEELWLKARKKDIRPQLNRAVGLGLFAGWLIIVQAWLLARVVSAVIIRHQHLAEVWGYLAAMLPIFALRFALMRASENVAFEAAAQVRRDLRGRLYEHLQALGPLWLTRQSSGDIANTIVTGIDALEAYYARYLPNMSLTALVPLSILVFVLPQDWVSGLVLLLTAPLIPIFMILIGKGTETLNQQQWQLLSRMSARFLDSLQGLTTLKLFGVSRHEAEVVAALTEEYRIGTMKVLRVAFLSSVALEFMSTISIAMVAVFIGFRLFYGEMQFFNGFFVLLLAPEFYLPLRNMGTFYHARMEAIGAAQNLLKLLDTPIPPHAQATGGTQKLDAGQEVRIRFEAVTVRHAADLPPALDAVSFAALPRGLTALVGASGAGKSTALHALMALVQPEAGRILVNDTPLTALDATDWLRHVAWVPQRPHVFEGTVRDNIALGQSDPPQDEVERAARAAQAHDFIAALPQGYDTPLGERGLGLSGGQVQRLALARALLKPAKLVLLDEATAQLDAQTQAQVGEAILALAKERCVILAAHRLSTVLQADHVVVLEAGRVIEQGAPADLLAAGGAFARLVRAHEPAVQEQA